MDQARATARVSDAQRLPQISVNGSVARARTGGVQTGGGALTTTQSTETLGRGLSWELDHWGRQKETWRAAEGQIGREPCTERARQYGTMSVVEADEQKKIIK